MNFSISNLQKEEYPPYYEAYFATIDTTKDIFNSLTELPNYRNHLLDKSNKLGKLDFAYASGKWSVKQVFSHLRDTEIIMTYRALCLARGEKNPLPGFDENLYQNTDKMENFNFESFKNQFQTQSAGMLALFKSFSDEDLNRKGTSNNYQVSVRGIISVIFTHEMHHLNILEERYLNFR